MGKKGGGAQTEKHDRHSLDGCGCEDRMQALYMVELDDQWFTRVASLGKISSVK